MHEIEKSLLSMVFNKYYLAEGVIEKESELLIVVAQGVQPLLRTVEIGW
jgi:hypothetical protein